MQRHGSEILFVPGGPRGFRRGDPAGEDGGAADQRGVARQECRVVGLGHAEEVFAGLADAASYHWAEGNPPIQARAPALAGKTLFVAGPPILVDEEEAWRHFDDPAIQAQLQAQAEALQGRRGGQIVAVAAADGMELSHYDLGASPTFDGMAAAYGRLYLSTLDGKLVCPGAQGRRCRPPRPPTSPRSIPP